MPREPAIFSASIVAVGDFNPAIFSPEWFQGNKLIGAGDADAAREKGQDKSLIVSHQVTTFQTKWFALQVLENQCSLTSKDALSPAFKDLAVGIFQLLPHTPISAIGMNFMAHFKLANEDDYHKIGDELAPKKFWTELFPHEMVGLTDLTMTIQSGTRGKPVETRDMKRVTVQPSVAVKFGVYLSYNDHRDLSGPREDNLRSAERAAILLDKDWEASWKDALRVFEGLLSMTLTNRI